MPPLPRSYQRVKRAEYILDSNARVRPLLQLVDSTKGLWRLRNPTHSLPAHSRGRECVHRYYGTVQSTV